MVEEVYLQPWMSNRADLERILKGRVTQSAWDSIPEVLRVKPMGHRIVVVREAPPERVGSIIIPKQHQAPVAAGWVVSVGPLVGTLGSDTKWPGGWHQHPEDLLLTKVLFGAFAGTALLLSGSDTRYESNYLLMTEADIHAVIEEENARSQ